MISTLLLVVSVLTFQLNAQEVQAGPDAIDLFKSGRAADARGDFDEALKEYDAAIKTKDQWEFRKYRGELRLKLRDWDGAANDFDQVVKQLPRDTIAHRYLWALALTNRTLARQGIHRRMHPDLEDYEAAMDAARGIVESANAESADLSEARQLIGIILVLEADLLMEQGQPEEALVRFNKASLLKTDHHWLCRAQLLAGRIAIRSPGWQQALERLRLAEKEAEAAGDPVDMALALTQLMNGERDPQKKGTAAKRLAELSFAGIAGSDYWNDWRTVQIAAFHSNQRNTVEAETELRKLHNLDHIRSDPELRYQVLFVQAHNALAKFDDVAVKAAVAESDAILKIVEPKSFEAMELRILQMELAAAGSDFKHALSLGEVVVEQISDGMLSPPSNMAAFPTETMASVLRTMAEIHFEMGMLSQALELVRRSISLYQEIKLEDEELKGKLLYAELWMYLDPTGKEEAPGNKPEWRRSLEELAPVLATGHPELRNIFHMVYAVGLFRVNEPKEAANHLANIDRQALSEAAAAQLHLFTAQIGVRSNRMDLATMSLADVANHLNVLPVPDRTTYYRLEGQVMLQQAHFPEALKSYRQAIDLADQLSAESPDVIFQANIRDPAASLYDEAIEAVLTVIKQSGEHHDDDLLEFLLKAVVPSRPVRRTGRNEELDLILNRLAEIRLLLALWPEFLRKHPTIRLTEEEDIRPAFRRDFGRYFSMLPEEHGEVTQERQKRAADFLRGRSQKSGHQIRLYYLGRTHGIIVVFERGKIAHQFVIPPQQTRLIPILTDKWKDAIVTLSDEARPAREASRQLLAILFPEGWRNTPTEIEIVAHEKLWDLSFETLITSMGTGRDIRYLDEVRTISYLTPVTLSHIWEGTKETVKKQQLGFFFVDPEILTPGVDPLPVDANFVSMIANAGIPTTHIFTNQAATERKLYSDSIQRSRWLHFLTHSSLENPWEGHVGLALAADPSIAKIKIGADGRELNGPVDYRRDGFLSPRDVETMDLRTDFVFLHGCQTSRSRVSFSLGLLGLISAFRAAGSEKVIASHWNVATRDEISRPVAAFYTDVLNSKRPLEYLVSHLRDSIRSQGGYGRHPYAWAAFSLYE